MKSATATDTFSALREEGARCRSLWLAVLGRIVMDAARADHDGAAARAWLRDPDELVMTLAGLEPDAAREAVARLANPASYAEMHGLGPSIA